MRRRRRHGPARRDARRPTRRPRPASPGGLGARPRRCAPTKPPALHDRDGWIDFGAGRRLVLLLADGDDRRGHADPRRRDARRSTASAWFDHQWGDFISVGGGGWDWFAVNLDDGTDLTLSLVRDADGTYPLVYGTLVDPRRRRRAPRRATRSRVEVTDRWTSPATGADYPAGWTIAIPAERPRDRLAPTVAAQELDTRATTGVIYWEGSQVVRATRGGRPLGGEAYVELTGYAPSARPRRLTRRRARGLGIDAAAARPRRRRPGPRRRVERGQPLEDGEHALTGG